MRRYATWRDFDWWLLGFALALAGVGILEIYSATHSGRFAGMAMRQLAWVGLGLVVMAILSRVDYHAVLDQAPTLYLLALGGLVFVLAFGHTRLGARRWLPVLGQQFQVSELAKLVIIVVLARYFSEVTTDRLSFSDLAKVCGLVGVPAGLILLQPNLGTALALVPAAVVGAFLAGVHWKHAAIVAILAGLMLPAGWHVLKPYQRERLVTFVHPEESPQGAGYQIIQSKIAVGAGGLWGKGLKKGTQNQLGFVPERHNDFIYAALAEEFGFAGVLVTLLLYLGILLRLVHNAQTASDRAGMFVVMGVLGILAFHILVNVAMVIGYMPVTGIPLPLLSYGGAATLFTFMALGMVMAVRMRRFVN